MILPSPLAGIGLDYYGSNTYKIKRLSLALFLIYACNYIHKNLNSPKKELSGSTDGLAMWLFSR